MNITLIFFVFRRFVKHWSSHIFFNVFTEILCCAHLIFSWTLSDISYFLYCHLPSFSAGQLLSRHQNIAYLLFFCNKAAAACIQPSYPQMGYQQTEPIGFYVVLHCIQDFFYQLLSLLSTSMNKEHAHNTDLAVHSTVNNNLIVLFSNN